jgi:ATP-dependent protease HslVU (ClpYQ) peptidase subunit
LKPPEEVNETGSIWIDPGTHRIMQATSGQMAMPSEGIYAVGAMTRGQIINASMARGIVQATSKIAEDLVDYLIRIRKS